MQSDLWIQNPNGGYNRISEADLMINGTVLSWTFTIPSEYNFDANRIEVTERIITK